MFVGDDEVTGRTSRDRGWRPANDPSHPPAFPSKHVTILARALFLAVAPPARFEAAPALTAWAMRHIDQIAACDV